MELLCVWVIGQTFVHQAGLTVVDPRHISSRECQNIELVCVFLIRISNRIISDRIGGHFIAERWRSDDRILKSLRQNDDVLAALRSTEPD